MTLQQPDATVLREGMVAPGVLLLTLDGPRTRNSIGLAQYGALRDALRRAGTDPAVRAVVLTGAQGFFSSGGNVATLRASREGTLAEAARATDALAAMILAARQLPKPLIAAVEGGAAGLGLSLTLACDMVVAAEGAKFTAAYVKIGLTPDGGATHFLAEALPRQLVSEMCLLGRPLSAERLHAAGAVNQLVPAGTVLEAALALARDCAAGPAAAMAAIKAEIALAASNGLAAQVELEGRQINAARFGAEAGEGLAAFLEKRPARFFGGGEGA